MISNLGSTLGIEGKRQVTSHQDSIVYADLLVPNLRNIAISLNSVWYILNIYPRLPELIWIYSTIYSKYISAII
jgi:hypothetical protein